MNLSKQALNLNIMEINQRVYLQHCGVWQDPLQWHQSKSCHPILLSVEDGFSDQDGLSDEDKYWMQQAIDQAQLAADQMEIPVGAVIVSKGQVIGVGYNSPIAKHDPTAHAEIVALRDACQRMQNYRLPDDAVLYVTLEPCTMCVGALIHARIARVVFGTLEPKAGSLVSARQLLQNGYYNHYFEFLGGCLAEQCSLQLKQFFKRRRQQKQIEKNGKPSTVTGK